MAFLGKVGKMVISQSKNPSAFQAVRSMSFVPNSKLVIGGVPSQSNENGLDIKDRARMMNDVTYRGGGYGIRSYSSAVGAASVGAGVATSGAVVGLVNVPLFWHINQGIKEILDDYVHHEMTRTVMLVNLRLFLIIASKDVFVSLVF